MTDYLELSKQRAAKAGQYDLKIESNIQLSIAYALIAIAEKLEIVIDHNDKEGAVRTYDVYS